MKTGTVPKKTDVMGSNRTVMQLETSGREGKQPRAQERKRDKEPKRERDIDTERDRSNPRKHINIQRSLKAISSKISQLLVPGGKDTANRSSLGEAQVHSVNWILYYTQLCDQCRRTL